ncbi:MAG: LemA family protein [Haemophilus parainfluenzae]|jgi:raw score 14.38|uniref:LemA family protein n=1 Tax=Haemophilus parainfluenzae ATCC 33392 TaxID=888828 RepID=A0ABD7ZFH9_HAEPA|nr:LemA family protein [Haemophilus parainfluenzae]EGC72454.1 LemA family protein [Haemophilus parainfluenzae ATCC 33392]KFL98495.1 LemA family protein [Haemophilus parainfluenzae ATCC 33392]MBF1224432.1 LemA family protein [Haemophilus parainfluenzae]QQB23459.1 LemA family protein [Haemophilus parainfluenzae]WMS23233.1 LemA family protein [Haemophilus parainfluenzae ATCC 33392]
MKKWIILIIIAIAAGLGLMSSYNGLVKAETEIDSVWANVESSYQRRADLIPNLVNTVKGQANFEQQTLTNVIEARAKATQTKIDPSNLTEEQLNEFQQNQNQVGSALSRLLVTVEQYPQLKANEGFMNLQAQLEGTENRINVARNKFNEAARIYNEKVRQFPTKLAAMIFGFKAKPYFKSATGAENAPTVNFN